MAEHTSTVDLSVEQWRPVVGYEGIYSVSSFGRLRSDRTTTCTYTGKILRPKVRKDDGYVQARIRKDRKPTDVLMHRVVAAAFIGPCPDDFEVNHRNANRSDNRSTNLEYVTPKENVAHSINSGNRPTRYGEETTQAKLTAAQVLVIKSNPEKLIQRELAVVFGVCRQTISDIQRGRRWRHLTMPPLSSPTRAAG
jgi:hypothetical protein